MELTYFVKESRSQVKRKPNKNIDLFSKCNSFICCNQVAQDKLIYLNYMVSVAKFLCSISERIRRGRPPSENKSKLASSKTVLNFDHEMHLPVKGKRRRCAYCSIKEANFRSNIKCFMCKLLFCLKEEKNCFFFLLLS